MPYLKSVATLLSTLALLSTSAGAQQTQYTPRDTALYRTIVALDSALFASYNNCDLPKFRSFLDDNLEFYHDQTGLMTGASNVTDAIKNNICGKVQRDLVAGSLQVYPLNGYGAVEIGVHQFRPPTAKPGSGGSAQFVQIWHNSNGVWKLTRVISFDHH